MTGAAERALWDEWARSTTYWAFADWVMIELIKERAHLGELLAVIHCDGGHHQAAVGTEQAVKDAIAMWNRLPRDAEGRLILGPPHG